MTDTAPLASIAEQRPVFVLLARLAEQFPGLPPAYVTAYRDHAAVSMWVDDAAGFEHWREALAIPAADVDLHVYALQTWVTAPTEVNGVCVELTADIPVPGHVAAVTPREDADRRYRVAQLDEQRHQLEDPAEPPLTAAGPAAAAPTVTIAKVQPLTSLQGGVA